MVSRPRAVPGGLPEKVTFGQGLEGGGQRSMQTSGQTAFRRGRNKLPVGGAEEQSEPASVARGQCARERVGPVGGAGQTAEALADHLEDPGGSS